MSPKTRNLVGWILAGILAAVFIMSVGAKFFSPESAKMAESMHISLSTLHTIGIVELVAAILFLIPRTGVLGSMLLSAYIGGIIATHTLGGQSLLLPIALQVVLFLTAILRFPEMAHRLMGRRTS